MNEREELEESLELLRYAFEELKEIRDTLERRGSLGLLLDDRIQDLIWKIGKQLGEF